MIYLHNNASKDEEYGWRLFKFAKKMVKSQKLEESEEQRIIQLSIEWPVDIQLDMMHTNPVPDNMFNKLVDLEEDSKNLW